VLAWLSCLELGADLHIAQLMPLPLTVSCFRKILIGFTFLVPAHLGSPGKRAVKRVCVCGLALLPLLAVNHFNSTLAVICYHGRILHTAYRVLYVGNVGRHILVFSVSNPVFDTSASQD